MQVGKEEFSYWLLAIPCELGGLGLELRKPLPDGTTYHVHLDGEHSTCECDGFLRWNHCKHVEALLALQADGRLPRPARQSAAVPSTDFDDNF
jgi:hypothetical protein